MSSTRLSALFVRVAAGFVAGAAMVAAAPAFAAPLTDARVEQLPTVVIVGKRCAQRASDAASCGARVEQLPTVYIVAKRQSQSPDMLAQRNARQAALRERG